MSRGQQSSEDNTMPTKDPGVSAKESGNMKIPELANSTGVSAVSGYIQSHTQKTQQTHINEEVGNDEGLQVRGHNPCTINTKGVALILTGCNWFKLKH